MKLAWIFLLLVSFSTRADQLRVGGFIVAPLVTGETAAAPIGGALIEFIEKEVLPNADLHVQWMPPMSVERATVSLRKGEIDVLLMVTGTPEDNPGIGVFSWSYQVAQPYLAVRPNSTLQSINTLDQLKGLTLGWSANSRSDIIALLLQHGARWDMVAGKNWQQLNLHKVAAGHIDGAFFLNQYSPAYVAKQEGIAVRLLPLPLPTVQVHMGYSYKADEEMLARFERAAISAFAGKKYTNFLNDYIAKK